MRNSVPDRAVLDAIKAVAERIDQLHFEALSPGIGLGNLRPRRKPGALTRDTQPMTQAALDLPLDLRIQVPVVGLPKGVKAPRIPRSSSKPPRRSLTRMLLAHGVDLGVIAITLLIAGKIAGYVLNPPAAVTLNYFSDVFQPDFYLQLGLLNVLLVVYLVFSLYWVFFKIFAGLTLGETLVARPMRSTPYAEISSRPP